MKVSISSEDINNINELAKPAEVIVERDEVAEGNARIMRSILKTRLR